MLLLNKSLVFFVCFLVYFSESTMVPRALAPAYVGDTVVIYFDVYNENLPNSVVWARTNYDGTNQIIYIVSDSTTYPARYSFSTQTKNTTYYVASLTIKGVISEDFATFTFTLSGKINLTQSAIATAANPLYICDHTTYNPVLYSLLLISNVILTITMIAMVISLWRGIPSLTKAASNSSAGNNKRNIASANSVASSGLTTDPRFHEDLDLLDIIIAFVCFISAVLLTILMLIFWISPSYAAPYEGSAYIYLSPLVIVPAASFVTFVLWAGLLYYVIKAFLRSSKILTDIITMAVFGVIAFIHLILILTIICSVVYCSGRSTLTSSSNYSVASVVCSALILLSSICLAGYLFWLFIMRSERLKSIGILNRIEKYTAKKPTDNVKLKPSFDAKKTNDIKVESVNEKMDTARSTKSVQHDTSMKTDDDNTDTEAPTTKGKGKKGKKGGKDAAADLAASAIAPANTDTEESSGDKKKSKKAKKAKEAAEGAEAGDVTDNGGSGGGKKKKGKKAKKTEEV